MGIFGVGSFFWEVSISNKLHCVCLFSLVANVSIGHLLIERRECLLGLCSRSLYVIDVAVVVRGLWGRALFRCRCLELHRLCSWKGER